MSEHEPLVRATLVRTGAPSPVPGLVPVDAAGLRLHLDVPAGVELERAVLTLQAPGEQVTVDLTPATPGVSLATSSGRDALPTAQGEPLTWLSLDWGTRRPLVSVRVRPATAHRAGRLSVAEGGPWYAPTPSALVALEAEVPLPGLFASRLLVEFYNPSGQAAPGAPLPAEAAPVSSVVVKASACPADLSVHLEPDTLFFHQAQPLRPQQRLGLDGALTETLRRAWPEPREGGRLTLGLRSTVSGLLQPPQLALDTTPVLDTWSGGEKTLALTLSGDDEAVGRVAVTGALASVRFRVEYAPRAEHLPLLLRPPAVPTLAQRCGSGFHAAQGFRTPRGGEALTGLDLHLRPLTREVRGLLWLLPDLHGRPADAPLAGAALTVSLDEVGPAPWPARWVSFGFERPVALPETWWVVLALTEGDVLWTRLTPEEWPDPEPPGALLYRDEATGPWLAAESPYPSVGRPLCTRPRLSTLETRPTSPPEVRLRRGARTLTVTPDETGLVSVDATALEALPPPAPPEAPLEVLVRSRDAGALTLSQLRVAGARHQTFTLTLSGP